MRLRFSDTDKKLVELAAKRLKATQTDVVRRFAMEGVRALLRAELMKLKAEKEAKEKEAKAAKPDVSDIGHARPDAS